MVRISAAGAVLWRPSGADVEIAVVHRPRYDDWSLPKGKLEPGESIWVAAAREVAEETGFEPVLGRHLGQITYPVGNPVPATKVVDYLAARVRSGRFQPNREVDTLRWVRVEEAGNLLSYPHDRDVVGWFRALPADLVTLALVRHAVAGSRKEWRGPDSLRPLTDKGWRDAKALAALLPLFGVDSVHAAAMVRCVQTVKPLAEELGVPVVEEPLLSEQVYPSSQDAAVARLREIVAGGATPVVCSQGAVIPDLLSRLAAESGLDLGTIQSRKGSAWILSFTRSPNPRLVAAHYIPKP